MTTSFVIVSSVNLSKETLWTALFLHQYGVKKIGMENVFFKIYHSKKVDSENGPIKKLADRYLKTYESQGKQNQLTCRFQEGALFLSRSRSEFYLIIAPSTWQASYQQINRDPFEIRTNACFAVTHPKALFSSWPFSVKAPSFPPSLLRLRSHLQRRYSHDLAIRKSLSQPILSTNFLS